MEGGYYSLNVLRVIHLLIGTPPGSEKCHRISGKDRVVSLDRLTIQIKELCDLPIGDSLVMSQNRQCLPPRLQIAIHQEGKEPAKVRNCFLKLLFESFERLVPVEYRRHPVFLAQETALLLLFQFPHETTQAVAVANQFSGGR